jgi:hypothetical protein
VDEILLDDQIESEPDSKTSSNNASPGERKKSASSAMNSEEWASDTDGSESGSDAELNSSDKLESKALFLGEEHLERILSHVEAAVQPAAADTDNNDSMQSETRPRRLAKMVQRPGMFNLGDFVD